MDKGKSVSWGSPGQSQGEDAEPRDAEPRDAEPRGAEEAYGTPPYGQPGPWAPAPPVQRPDPTPPAGTHLPPPNGAAPADAIPAGAPPTGTPRPPQPPATTPPPMGTPHPAQAAPQAQMGTPPVGTPYPAQSLPQAGTAATAPVPSSASAAPPAAAPSNATLPGHPMQRYDPWGHTPGGGVLMPAPPGTAPGGEPHRRGRGRLLAGAAAIALIAGVMGGAIGVQLERDGTFSEVELPQTGAASEGEPAPEGSIAGIAEDVLPGVVTLHVSGADAAGTGTGFVLDGDGHILTNAHVVAPAGDAGVIEVTFSSGDTAQAEVVGYDTGYDLAVVEVEGVSGLSPLELGDSDAVRVGDPVVAIGAPFDLAGTVTSGIISAMERPITAGGSAPDGSDVSYVNALQTDAPINPGNSGGPLVDVNGRVIGVNSAIRTGDSSGGLGEESSGSVGLGFAIPINQGRDVAEQLINTGYATHPVIGVMLDTGYLGEGARVGSTTGEPAVTPGGPAEAAGVLDGDIITEVDGEPVRSGDELIVKIRSYSPGDQLELTIDRDGEEISLDVTLGEERGD
jgi:putative serine protease PepD